MINKYFQILFTPILCSLVQIVAFGQDAQYTQYMLNNLQFNPATTGNENAIINTLDIRNQWVSLPGAPASQNITSSMPIFRISSGIGLSVNNTIEGQQRTTNALINFAYHKHFKTSTFSFGLSAGIVQRALDGSKLITPTGNYIEQVNHNDPDLPVTLQSNLIPDFGFGTNYLGKHLQIAISATHLMNSYFNFRGAPENSSSSMQFPSNGYIYVAYKIILNPKWMLMPNILFKTDLTENIVDFNTLVIYNNNIFTGVSFRSFINNQTDAIAIMAGMNLTEKLSLSYSYDITISSLKTVSDGSHEIVLKYRIPIQPPKNGKKIYNFRYLYY